MDIHEKIRKLLQDANMNPTQVAKALELKQPSVYSWCNGDSKPSKTSIMKLSKLFNVDPSYLLSESAAENGKKMAPLFPLGASTGSSHLWIMVLATMAMSPPPHQPV